MDYMENNFYLKRFVRGSRHDVSGVALGLEKRFANNLLLVASVGGSVTV